MKEFSMKKSMLMLVALFMLGAWSTKDDDVVVNDDWKKAVSDMYVHAEIGGGSVENYYKFSNDASELYGADLDGTLYKDCPHKIQSGSTVTSATYSASFDDGEIMTVKFTNLSGGKGDIEATIPIAGDMTGTFTLSETLPSN